MSIQDPAKPLYIVERGYNIHRICQIDERGVYRIVVQMQGPFDHHEAALKLCDMMNAIGEPLPQMPVGDQGK